MTRAILRIFLVFCGIAGLCLLYGFLIEPRQLKLREVSISSPHHTGAPVRIALASDIHIGGYHVPAARVKAVVATINAQSPDLVLLPGDFISGHTPRSETSLEFDTEIDAGLAHLSALQAPTFATIGNHDAWYDAAYVAKALELSGITVLDNQAQQLGGLCVVGLADADTNTPDRAAYRACETGATTLTLTHSPDAYTAFRSDTALAVAGHTHGGQINLPIIGRRVNAARVGAEHSYGLSKLGGVPIFVTAGIGTSMLPARFRAPPEIVVITVSAQQD